MILLAREATLAMILASLTLAQPAVPQPTAAPAPTSVSPESIREVQRALKDAGHDPGPIDGILGPRTKGALRTYASAPSPGRRSATATTIERFQRDYAAANQQRP